MKLTDPPFATVSMRISLSIARVFGEALNALISISDMASSWRGRRHSARRGAFVGQRHLGRAAEAEAVAGAEQMPLAALHDDEFAAAPRRLADMRVGRGRQRHALSSRHFDLDDLQGMIGPAEHLPTEVAGVGIAPDRLVGDARHPLCLALGAHSRPARVRSKAPASRTRITAVGLASSRSILLIVALETPARSQVGLRPAARVPLEAQAARDAGRRVVCYSIHSPLLVDGGYAGKASFGEPPSGGALPRELRSIADIWPPQSAVGRWPMGQRRHAAQTLRRGLLGVIGRSRRSREGKDGVPA